MCEWHSSIVPISRYPESLCASPLVTRDCREKLMRLLISDAPRLMQGMKGHLVARQNLANPMIRGGKNPLHSDSEYLEKYWATRSSARSFARTAQSFACYALLASFARSAALTRSLACSLTHCRARGEM